MRSVVEGASDSTHHFRRRRLAEARAPPPLGACHRAGHFGPDPLGRSPSPVCTVEDKDLPRCLTLWIVGGKTRREVVKETRAKPQEGEPP
jgi:hypothetical protein